MYQLLYAPRTVSIAGTIAVANAIKTSTATSASPQTYSSIGYSSPLPRQVTVTTSSSVGSYVAGSTITFTGTDSNGNPQTEILTLTQANGNETVKGNLGFSTVTSITVQAQVNASGAFTWGVQDIFIPKPCVQVRVGTPGTGTATLKYTCADGSIDAIPKIISGEELPIAPIRVIADAITTVQDLTFFFSN